MQTETLSRLYLEERSSLFAKIVDILRNEPGVKASWLFGSLGSGEADVLSDIDIWVVVDDDRMVSIFEQPGQIPCRISHPILFLEVPQNAPDGGAYCMSCHDAPVAPHIVDWYWQPVSKAYIPEHVQLIFDRVGLEHRQQPIYFPGQLQKRIIEQPIHFVSFFWMMLMIAAKYAYRSPQAEMDLLPLLLEPIQKAQRFLGQDDVLKLSDLPEHGHGSQKMQVLDQLSERMTNLMMSISERGEDLPSSAPAAVTWYLALVEVLRNGS